MQGGGYIIHLRQMRFALNLSWILKYVGWKGTVLLTRILLVFDKCRFCGNYNDLITLSAEQYPKDNISISNVKYLYCLCRKEIIPT